MSFRKPSWIGLGAAVFLAGCAVPIFSVAAYEARNVGISVRLAPASYGGFRAGLEPGDTIAIAGGDLIFPGLFGNYYLHLNSSTVFRWRRFDSESAVHAVLESGRMFRATSEGTFSAIPSVLRLPRIGRGYAETFNVLPERIDTVLIEFAHDTLALGDTLTGRFEARGVSGAVLTICSPLITSTGGLDVQSPFNGCESTLKGVAREPGDAAIEMTVGHHRTIAHVFVTELRRR